MRNKTWRRRRWFVKAPAFLLCAALVAALVGWITMSLWNWLLPAIFGFHAITFWQALGLMFLGRFLLGGFRGGRGRRDHWRHRMMERWEQMTPEERERFVAGMGHWRGGRCGGFEPPPAAAAEPKPSA